jgi:hypothetical protein
LTWDPVNMENYKGGIYTSSTDVVRVGERVR